MDALKKIRHVSPKYPELSPKTIGSGMWLGEVLIDTSWKVAQIWPLREVELTPPFPPFNRAITHAIRQWEYEPPLFRGKAMPMCMVVTVNINWQRGQRSLSFRRVRDGRRDRNG